MHREKIEKLINYIVKTDRLDMERWITEQGTDVSLWAKEGGIKEISCGTKACAWGHIAVLFHEEMKRLHANYQDIDSPEYEEFVFVSSQAQGRDAYQLWTGAKILGIEPDQASLLFYRSDWPGEYMVDDDEYDYEEHEEDLRRIEKKNLLAMLRRGVSEGSFDFLFRI